MYINENTHGISMCIDFSSFCIGAPWSHVVCYGIMPFGIASCTSILNTYANQCKKYRRLLTAYNNLYKTYKWTLNDTYSSIECIHKACKHLYKCANTAQILQQST